MSNADRLRGLTYMQQVYVAGWLAGCVELRPATQADFDQAVEKAQQEVTYG